MKRIIKGKTYNTDTATRVISIDYNSPDHPNMEGEELYQTRHEAFFLVLWREIPGEGDLYATIKPLTDDEALTYLEKYDGDLVEQYFGTFPEAGAAERRLTIRIPGNLADRVEAAAKENRLSLNSYAMRCFERCVSTDGQPQAGLR
jgi:predicted HicB family RNase H-like nuclease